MRVTDSFRIRTVINNLNSSRERLNRIQEDLANGKRIHRPSDDPLSAANSLRIKTTLEGNAQFEKNIDDSIAYLTAAEAALDNLSEILMQVKEIVTEGASDSIVDRKHLATQLELILKNMVEVGNAKFNGKYIFGGTKTITPPFTLNENELRFDTGEDIVNYRGNNDYFKRQINENTVISLNITGSEVFQKSGSSGVDLFQLLKDLIDKFKQEDLTGERVSGSEISPYIDVVNRGIDQVLESYLKIGTRKQLVIFNRDRFQTQDIQLKANLSKLEDTDFGEAFVQFKAEENALNAALSAGARVISPSLLDFLGI
ncbi:flagellar hook-associated protein 3 [candidate division KSB1 bacterium]|nr:MAG: flagellar hook-associated protein 3 [candidate division KSB1 bacterium]